MEVGSQGRDVSNRRARITARLGKNKGLCRGVVVYSVDWQVRDASLCNSTYLEEMAQVDILVREVKRDNRIIQVEISKDENRSITKARVIGIDYYTT